VTDAERRRFAVIGSPISHSRSPRIHQAAYASLGLNWEYEAIDVLESDFDAFVAGLRDEWHGLSVTMPLKRRAFQLAATRDAAAVATSSVNTLLRRDPGWAGFNTDVPGIITCIEKLSLSKQTSAVVLGAGATAASVVYSLCEMGFETVDIAARRVTQAGELVDRFGSGITTIRALQLGHDATATDEDDPLFALIESADVIVNTLPGEASAQVNLPDRSSALPPLFDINYDPWPTPLCSRWDRDGISFVNGLELLVQQALIQVRIFVNGDATRPLPNEELVLRAMQEASVER
jgi:shikimate dehydrogenase